MKKDLGIIGGLFLLIVILVIFGREFTSVSLLTGQQEDSLQSTPTAAQRPDFTNVTIGTLSVNAEVADENEERKEGLSKRESLPIADGMLFVFEKSESVAIWMKDMQFPIDIIWIDESSGGEKKVVDTAENAVPEPGKDDDELKRYIPKAPAKYILEVNAGLVRSSNIKIGDTVKFTL